MATTKRDWVRWVNRSGKLMGRSHAYEIDSVTPLCGSPVDGPSWHTCNRNKCKRCLATYRMCVKTLALEKQP